MRVLLKEATLRSEQTEGYAMTKKKFEYGDPVIHR